MKEFIEKLIGRLEEEATSYKNDSDKEYGQGAYEQAKEDMIASVCLRRTIQIVSQLAEEYTDTCEWRLIDDEANVYDTACRNPHILIDGSPEDNNYEFCPYCGKRIKVVK